MEAENYNEHDGQKFNNMPYEKYKSQGNRVSARIKITT